MFYASTNKTEESWCRMGIRKMMPNANPDEIFNKISSLSTSGMKYETAVDFYSCQLATWRRFYKQDDSVIKDESIASDGTRITKIRSMNIIFTVSENKDGHVKCNGMLIKET